MILIWGLKKPHYERRGPAGPEVIELRARSMILLDQLAAREETVILPTVAVSEVLAGVESAYHGTFLAELQELFVIQPYDLPAASWAARLWQMHRGLPKEDQIARSVLKSDVMILATAKAAGAAVFFSHEPKVRNLAEMAGMAGRDLPFHHEDMFADQEVRRRAAEE
jgi:predicted nucleic acid-binding protein